MPSGLMEVNMNTFLPVSKAGTLLLSTWLLLTAAGCSTINDPLAFVEDNSTLPALPELFGEKPAITALGDIHQLTQAQQDEFTDYFNAPANRDVDPHMRLANYLLNDTDNFLYESRTYTASEALAMNRGNCMSLAVVTTALARLAELEIEYQLIDSTPVYEVKDSVANKGVHIRSLIYKPDDMSDTRRSGIQIDYFPSENGRFVGNVNFDQYVALYYRNIAARAISEEDYNLAYWYTRESMIYDALSPDALNMLAVTYKRIGELEKAEEIYRYGISQAEEKLTLLKNYHILLTESGREEEAEAVNNRLASMHDPSPVHWFNVARYSYNEEDFDDAIVYYNRAIEIAPYLHEAHLGIALSYYRLGRIEQAEQAFNRAINNVNDVVTRDRYESKLQALHGSI
ncbi:MAG: hypothetical protein CMQ38_11005 [Gammaproteobacteria bacterium]|nr:hypothetical protein [Gammaproteobacteria bacterium]